MCRRRVDILKGLISAVLLWVALPVNAGELDWVRVSDDGQGFTLSDTNQPFVPWGFNYDHEGDGRLLEDYWHDEWSRVESAFAEMKRLGANVVRIHLQFGRFMNGPNEPRQVSLEQLQRLLQLAERTGLYIDLTGLGCYHKQDVPPWYDKLEEPDRWQAQAVFWEAVAKTCAASPAIFCYDLMNEPVIPGGEEPRDDWLGPAFGDKHFVQFIALDRRQRQRSDIAKDWIRTLVSAVRKHDQRHLITVGLVPWSLDRPGLTSGFVPQQIAGDLDFIAMHIYPERGKLAEALETLRGFAVEGKPVVIEETFPLKCDAHELEQFLDRSRDHATGWIGFYWGKMPEELRPPQTIADGLTLQWLELFQKKRDQFLGTDSGFLQNGVTAHRGNSAEFPENTMPAFRSAIEVGADWIELDILRTRDGQLVVIHDTTTNRVGDKNLVVAESTYEELAAVDVASDFRQRTGVTLDACPPQRIPLLKEVLDVVLKQSHTRVSLQPKTDCVAEAVALVKNLNAERWVGFNDGNLAYLREVKQLAPALHVFWDRGPDTDLGADIQTATAHGFEALVLHHRGATTEKIRAIQAAGMEAGAWTVNDPQTIKRLQAMGVERFYTDDPRMLISIKAM